VIAKTLALVRRALRVDVRHARSHLFRATLAGIVLWMLFWIQDRQLSMSAPGLTLFSEIAYTNYWFITLAGATFFASAITEEKEERTLSLLKIANIGPLSMLLGKWLPRLLGAVFLIAIQIPFMMLAITLGGVLWNQITAVYVALLAHLFLMGNLGLLASVVMPRTGSACGLVFVVLLAIQTVFPILGQILKNEFGNSSGIWLVDLLITGLDGLTSMNALWSISAALRTGFQGQTLGFQLISNIIAGSVLFGLAWFLFDRCTSRDEEPEAEPAWQRMLRQWGGRRTAGRVWDWPLVWKDYTYLAGGHRMQVIKFVCYGILIVGLEALYADWQMSRVDSERLGGIAISWALFLVVIEAALLGTRMYRLETTQQTWSTLMLLPRNLPEIAYPKLGGGALALLPAMAWLGIGCLLTPHMFRFFSEILNEPEAVVGIWYFLTQVLLGLHLSVWLSVAAKWAIWPLAIASGGFAVFMSNMMLVSCIMGIGGNSIVEPLGILAVIGNGITIWVHVLIARRLRAAAAE
jgi:ABC-type transport system involved in multi-copper enzyme maturation permease subunit